MTAILIGQPGSDRQLTYFTQEIGRARDITCLLILAGAVVLAYSVIPDRRLPGSGQQVIGDLPGHPECEGEHR